MFTAGLIDWSLAARRTLAIALFLAVLLVLKPRNKPLEMCLLSLLISASETEVLRQTPLETLHQVDWPDKSHLYRYC